MAENDNDTDCSSNDEDDFMETWMYVKFILHPFFAGVNKTRVCNQELADFPAMSFFIELANQLIKSPLGRR